MYEYYFYSFLLLSTSPLLLIGGIYLELDQIKDSSVLKVQGHAYPRFLGVTIQGVKISPFLNIFCLDLTVTMS